jgi:aminoglycoside 2'-N-acetyltransferase I
MEIRTAHTADISVAGLTAVRTLLVEVFGAGFGDSDWDHSLGGIHATVWESDTLIGHASLIQRRLGYDGKALRTGYVEAVAVRPEYRRQGFATALMRAVERFIVGAYEVGALSATEQALDFYTTLGWRRWRGPTWSLTPHGCFRTPNDDGSVFILPVTADVDVDKPITCDWRGGDPW